MKQLITIYRWNSRPLSDNECSSWTNSLWKLVQDRRNASLIKNMLNGLMLLQIFFFLHKLIIYSKQIHEKRRILQISIFYGFWKFLNYLIIKPYNFIFTNEMSTTHFRNFFKSILRQLIVWISNQLM